MRRIKHAEVKRLALCRRGRNGLRTLFKADGTLEVGTLCKTSEQGQLLSVMWPKGLVDIDGDFADTDEAIESMMSSLIANGGQLDIEHEGEPLRRDQARVTEVFRIQPGDPRFADWTDYDGQPVDVTGGAAVAIQIDDPAIRKAFREGGWDGVSLYGPAAVEQVDVKAASQPDSQPKPLTMTKEELQELLKAQEARFVEMLTSAAEKLEKAAPKPVEQPKPVDAVAPRFEGDPMSPADLETFEKSLRAHEMAQKIAAGTMTADDIAAMRKALSESSPTVNELVEAGIPARADDSPELRKAQLQVFRLQKSSNAGLAAARVDEDGDLEKSQLDFAADIARIANARLSGEGGGSSSLRIVNK